MKGIYFILGLGVGVGAGIGIYYLSKPKLGPRTNVIMNPNYYNIPTLVYVYGSNAETFEIFEEFIETEFIDDVHVIPLRIPYGIYNLSFKMPGCLPKYLGEVIIDGNDVVLRLLYGFGDINNDGIVDSNDFDIIDRTFSWQKAQ